ncbi:FAD/NADP-binding domain-containing protein [Dacryopinax primogenitus]|uniref:FAD/NADP-binding domain-containing protein n=1 Tax=Dacryopinax primogenitus (strain DJM 731) TaxID=1858805 RepID=M5GAL1_DACPD|nr:FAD/NADP-binding domain-containing protein [Dacryopinax primogenitus]EJU02997.1 FAD/NADP-binding domain-containing protein [Dacryopinax primogenitus]
MKIIIAGSGVEGPVLGMLLKQEGFDPVIYERADRVGGGIAVVPAPQTFRVFQILGLAEELLSIGAPCDTILSYSVLTAPPTELLRTDAPKQVRSSEGWPIMGIARDTFVKWIVAKAQERGVEIHLRKGVKDVREVGDKVVVGLNDGTEDEADLVIGADGLHSRVREVLFGKDQADFCKLIEIGGHAKTPDSLLQYKSTILHWYGSGIHLVSFPINPIGTERMWVCTLAEETEAHETWRALTREELHVIMKSLPVFTDEHWAGGPRDLITNHSHFVKYGLYDRPPLDSWHMSRIVLAGDAAHPTSPHLGQGTNQAMEDAYHLVRVLCEYKDGKKTLDEALKEYEQIRLPRVSALVAQARKEGELRVVVGEEASKKRDEELKKGFDREALRLYLEATKGPYTGETAT